MNIQIDQPPQRGQASSPLKALEALFFPTVFIWVFAQIQLDHVGLADVSIMITIKMLYGEFNAFECPRESVGYWVFRGHQDLNWASSARGHCCSDRTRAANEDTHSFVPP